MRASKGRRFAAGVVGSSLTVLVLSAWYFRQTVAEQWYLWRLESSELEERRTAIRVLGTMRSERAIQPFREMMLDDELDALRTDLLQALVDIGPVTAEAIASLIPTLAKPVATSSAAGGTVTTAGGATVVVPPSGAGTPPPDAAALLAAPAPGGAGGQPPPDHFDIIAALVKIGPAAAPALVAAVVPGFSGGDLEPARQAGVALKAMEAEAEGAIVKLLGDRDPDIRRRTAFVVGWTGIARQGLVPSLAAMLSDPASEMRTAAAYAFKNFGEHVRDAMPQLTAAFGDENEEVSRQAIDALAASGVLGEEAVAPLLEILRDASRDERVRRAAVRGLGALGPRARSAAPELVTRVQTASDDLAFEAVLALGKIGPYARAAVPVLLEEIDREDRLVRVAVVRALGKIAPHDRNVVRRLRPLVEAADEEVVLAARQALKLGALDSPPALDEEGGSPGE